MDTATWLALGAFVLAFAALVLALLHRAIFRRMLGERAAGSVLLERDYAADRRGDQLREHLARGPRGNRQLVGPPMVGAYTLRDWLIHSTQRDGVWAEVVAEFYNRAAAVPWVLDYFGPVLARPDGMAQLQRHFVAQLVIVTHTGVTSAMLDDLGSKHAGVTNSKGQAITDAVFDAVRDTLAGVLTDSGAPDQAVAQLARTIEPFRSVLVRA